MPSTYSPDLRIELIATGEQSGTWGATTNTNLGTLIEDAISGLASVSVTSANQALTANNGLVDQARCSAVALTTTTTANFAVYVPPVTKLYVIFNSSAYVATIYCSTAIGNTTAAGTGVAVPAGKAVLIRSTGTDIVEQLNYVVGHFGVGGNLSVTGTSTLTGAVSAPAGMTGNVTGNLVGNVTGNVTGNLLGNVTGNVTGNLVGNVTGNVTGNLLGNVTGTLTGSLSNVTGNLVGNVTGNVTGNLTGNVTGNVAGNLTGNVNGNVTGNVTGNLTGSVSAGSGTIATSNFTITEVGGVLYFKYGGTNIGKLDSSGNFTVIGNVTAYGSV